MYDQDKTREQLLEEVKALRDRLANLEDERTRRRRAEEELRESRHLLNALLEGEDAAVFVKDRHSRYLRINSAGARMVGKSVDEVLGTDDTTLFSPETARQILEDDRHILESGTAQTFEQTTALAGGECRTFLVRKAPLRDDRREIVGIIGTARDVTDRSRTERALRESEERCRQIVETANEGVWTLDADGRTDFINRRGAEILGYSAEEMLGRRAVDFLFPEDVPAGEGALEARRRGVRGEAEYRMRARDGSEVWVHATNSPLLDGHGQYRGALAIFADITTRKGAEAALHESLEHHRLIAELTSDYAYTARVDPDGTIRLESATEGFLRVTGYTLAEVEQHGGWASLIHPADGDVAQHTLRRTLAGERHVGELRLLTRGGDTRWIQFSTHPLWDAGCGRVVRLLGAVRDVTERKRADERLQTLSRRLMDIQEAERRHIARELHDEIGQLLTGLKLILETGGRTGEALDLVQDLMDRVRDLSLRLRPAMLDDLGLLPTLLWHFQRYTTQTKVHVAFTHSGLERRFVPRVETAAYRIVQEALTNVARHAAVREVAVVLWANPDRLTIQVEDRGAGFAVESAPTSADSSGLDGMRERVLLLGGRLHVESKPGAGTCLVAELPLNGQPEP